MILSHDAFQIFSKNNAQSQFDLIQTCLFDFIFKYKLPFWRLNYQKGLKSAASPS